MTEIHGICDPEFIGIRETFAKNFDKGYELGGAFALAIDGELVVDIWAGAASLDGKRPWKEDTIVPVASSTKIPVSLCGLMLVDRGLIDLDAPIATYWPEFAANGKEKMPVRYIFSHQTGLPGLDGMPGFEVLSDFDEVTKRLAAQKPWWEPGTASGYQGMTYGNLIGELVRRTTGKSMSEFFYDEVTAPLRIDFSFGCSDEDEARLSEIDDSDLIANPVEPDKFSMAYRANEYLAQSIFEKKQPFWKMNIPAANGVGNARAFARLGSMLASGGILEGHRIIREETAFLPYQEQSYTVDKVFQMPTRFGVGFGMASKEIPLPWENAFHWGGRGGSLAVMVPEHCASWSYTPNLFLSGVMGDERGTRLGAATNACLLAREGK